MKSNRDSAIVRATLWQTLTAAPHRPMFLAGAIQGIAVMMWWLLELLGRYGGLPHFSATIAAPAAHAYLMLYGFFPWFIFGFLLTTYPAWLDAQKIPRRRYVSVFVLMAGGHLLFYAGLAASATVATFGVLLVLIGWGTALATLAALVLRTSHPDKRHAYVTTAALTAGWLGAAAFAGWLLTGDPRALKLANSAGVWLFLLPIVFTVSHRMIPFFSSRVLENYALVRPFGWLWLGLAAMLAHALLGWLESSWIWVPDLLLMLAALYLAIVWEFWRSLKNRLLAVLHLAFLWLAVGAALSAAQQLAVLFGAAAFFGSASLHAIVIGYCASMILAMASRVTLGHSGRALVADRVTWAIFLAFQAAALARVAFEVLPGRPIPALFAAAAIWLACFGAWAFKYAPSYWQVRVDGRAG